MGRINADTLKRIGVMLLNRIPFMIGIIVIFVALTIIMNVFIISERVTGAFVAAGTLTLAIAAFWAIRHSNEQEKHRREDELLKEGRLRDKDELNEIIAWAVDIAKCEIPAEATALVGIKNAEADRMVACAHLRMLANSFRAMIGKSLYTSKIVFMFEKKLQSAVDKLTTDLDAHLKLINECVDTANNNRLSEFKRAIKQLTAHWQILDQSTDKVIEEGCINKLNILNF